MQLNDVGVVVLNYMTIEAPKEMIGSLKKIYPNVRTLIADNGSPENVIEELEKFCGQLKNTNVLQLGYNYGYSKGMNAGIKKLREEGYEYICCSISHILIKENDLLESLKNSLDKKNAAVAGPRIITTSGKEENPFRIKRPSPSQAKKTYDKYGSPLRSIKALKKKLFNNLKEKVRPDNSLFLIKPLKKLVRFLFAEQKVINNMGNDKRRDQHSHEYYVYSLHGSIIMFGPQFFQHYEGFDETTFLYNDEYIISEMLLAKNLKAVYNPKCRVVHREDITSRLVWKDKREKMVDKHRKVSVKHWYYNHYLKNNRQLKNL